MGYVPMRISDNAMLPVLVAQCGLRTVLRKFIRHRETSFVAILTVPDWEDVSLYKTAASRLLSAKPDPFSDWDESTVVMSVNDLGHETSRLDLFDTVRSASRVVIYVRDLDEVPPIIRTLADFFGRVDPPKAAHYLASARALEIVDMTAADADFLAEQSLEAIKIGFRKGRPLINSIRRLKRQRALEAEVAVVPTPTKPAVTLEEMEGYGSAKDWGLRLAEDISAWRHGEIGWEDVDRGVLIYGPPGCGKTTYAQALANSCGVELVSASAARWQARGHLGDYLKAMRAGFAEAKEKSPAILFIDEFDSVGSREEATRGDNADYMRQAINGLLECLDPSEGREGVVVIGATNDIGAIDPALLRPGRLEIAIQIPLPDDAARVAILRHHLAGYSVDGELSEFVAASRGYSGADIMKLARDARRLARRKGVPMDERLVLEVMPYRRPLSAKERRRLAAHEAGHAILAALLTSEVLHYVYISDFVPSGNGSSLGGAACTSVDDVTRTIEWYEDRIAMLLGGIAAEVLLFGNHADGAGGIPMSDLAIASDLATTIERRFGFGESLVVDLGQGDRPLEFLRSQDPDLRRQVDDRLRSQFDRAKTILSNHHDQLERLVGWLTTRGRVEGEEVRALVKRTSRIDVCLTHGSETAVGC